jgi:hypothetical protein
METEIYVPPNSSPVPEDFDLYYASLSEREKELHKMAVDLLGSSYFVQWSHGYKKWKANQVSK